MSTSPPKRQRGGNLPNPASPPSPPARLELGDRRACLGDPGTLVLFDVTPSAQQTPTPSQFAATMHTKQRDARLFSFPSSPSASLPNP